MASEHPLHFKLFPLPGLKPNLYTCTLNSRVYFVIVSFLVTVVLDKE